MYALRDHLFAVLVGAMAMAMAVVVATAVSAAALPHTEEPAASSPPANRPAVNERPAADPPLSALITATGGACAATMGVMALCQSKTRRRPRPLSDRRQPV